MTDPRQPESPHAEDADWAEAVEESLAASATLPGALLPVLHGVQDRLGWIPPAALPRIASALNLSHADVHGVVSFYHDFRHAPPGRHVVKICRAEACQSVGSERLCREFSDGRYLPFGKTAADGSVTLEAVYCLGNCALGPSAMVDGRLHGRVTAERLESLVAAPGGAPRGGRA